MRIKSQAHFEERRVPHFNWNTNVERAITDGHPEPGFLAQLAKVISDEAKIESLNLFDVWRKTKT